MKLRAFGLLLLAACTAGEKHGTDVVATNVIDVVGTDYAFTLPATIRPGRTTLHFTNRGKVRHELNVSRLRKGVTIDSLLASRNAGRSVKDLIDGPVGVLFAEPEGRSESGLTFDAGDGERYAVVCIFRDSAEAKRHYELGMYAVITVAGDGDPAAPQIAADTVVATDYAFSYARDLSPGAHTFVMRNAGKQRHELAVMLLRKGVGLDSLMKVTSAGGDADALMEGSFGLLHAESGQTTLGGMTIEMIPEREYVIACFFRDRPGEPEHVDLGMFGAIRTGPRPGT